MKLSQLVWTTRKKEVFLASVVLTREELNVFNDAIQGYSYEDIAEKYIWSVKKVNRIIESLKNKYDIVQKENPDVLEPLIRLKKDINIKKEGSN